MVFTIIKRISHSLHISLDFEGIPLKDMKKLRKKLQQI